MKIIFNDASEMTIQSATIRTDGALLIKTISATEDELRNTFQDEFRTKKITVTERETTVAGLIFIRKIKESRYIECM